ncbi:MAG: antibiotic biosynthesis monooxygenase [Bacteroides sp.]|nr:antibiotic biosynthesis monooxygenase [Bacteroides sp.]
MITIVARCVVKKGCKEDFVAAVQKMITESRKEPGNVSYTLMKDVDNEDALAFIEEWKDPDAIEEHGAQLHFREGIGNIRELIESMDIVKYEAV